MGKIRIKQIKSSIGYKYDQKDTLKRLGLNKIRQEVVKDDNPQIRGMIEKVRHLVSVEEVEK
jgi:large subunit ribosomal protein L30